MTLTAPERTPATVATGDDGTGGDAPARRGRVLQPRVVAVVSLVVLLVAAVTYDALVYAQLRDARGALHAVDQRLTATHRSQIATTSSLHASSASLERHRAAVATTSDEITSTERNLSTASRTEFFQTLDLAALDTCLGGVSNATSDVAAANVTGAVQSINAVSSSCLALDGSRGGPVYPFDFPDPFVLPFDNQYYAFATNSVAGNVQIIDSTDLVHWTAVGDALPHLAPWAQPGATWAPSVLQRGNTFVMYYSAVFANSGEQCISEAVASAPQGPYLDDSAWPIVCQLDQGGSIDPSPVVAPDGTPYLVWKSQGANGAPATLWSQQLTPDGTALVTGAPSGLLQPSEAWQHGSIEGPDMVVSGGQYLLFYSGSDWKTSSYAVGYASCDGPLGPCTDQSPQPLLASQSTFSGPGGPALFTDAQGTLWMAFHAWIAGKVGYPNSRPLFLRQVTITGGVPVVSP